MARYGLLFAARAGDAVVSSAVVLVCVGATPDP